MKSPKNAAGREKASAARNPEPSANPTKKPLVIITANTAWNVYSRRRLIREIQGAGFGTLCMGSVGSMSGTRGAQASAQSTRHADHAQDGEIGKTEKAARNENPEQSAESADTYSLLINRELSSEFIPLPMEGDGTNPFKDIRLFLRFLRIYKKRKPAAVLHFNNKPDIYGSLAASLLSVPSLSNITGLGVVAEKRGLTAKLVYTLFRAAFASKKAFVFFQNRDDREFFLSHGLCRPQNTEVIPGSGVDTDFFRPDGAGGSGGGARRARRDGGARFLFSGRFLETKGCGDFLRAAETVKKRVPSASFVLIGEHDRTNPIFIPESQLAHALETGTAVWPGLVPDVRPYIAEADCVVLPSYYREGVPRVLLEAAAMGKPLIAADSPGTREPVEDGVNGFLCKPADHADLAAKMLAYLSLPDEERARMGDASRRLAETRFSDGRVAEAYLRRLSERTGLPARNSGL